MGFDSKKDEENFWATGDAISRRTLKSMQEVFARMPWDQVFDLPGGEQAVIKQFIEPRINGGVAEFGFDVRDTLDTWHLEFFVRQTGWGGPPIGEVKIPQSGSTEPKE
jgi:hypothetical protein